MAKEQDKEIHTTKCKKCGEVLDISLTSVVRRLVTQAQSLKEALTDCERKCMDIRNSKNGQIQKLHATISQILMNISEKEKKKVYKFVQDMRKKK